MAVTRTNDVGALIAESIDSFYNVHSNWERGEVRALRRRAYFEGLRVELKTLQEAAGDFDNHTSGGSFDDPRQTRDAFTGAHADGSESYRSGYKTGWKAAKDGNPHNPPETHAGDQHYLAGYDSGYKKSGHARQLLQHHANKDWDQADELAAKHFTGPSMGHHMPMNQDAKNYEEDWEDWQRYVGAKQDPGRGRQGFHGKAMDHVVNAINLADQHLDLDDDAAMGGLDPRQDPGEGLHHLKFRPHPADIGPHLAGRRKGRALHKAKKGGMKGVEGARDPVKIGGAIFNPGGGEPAGGDFAEIGGDYDPKNPRGGGARGVAAGGVDYGPGGYGDDPVAAAGDESGSETGDAGEGGRAGGVGGEVGGEFVPAAAPERAEKAQAGLGEFHNDLLRLAVGDDAYNAHEAHGRGEEGGQHHQGIADFRSKDYQVEHYDDFIKHAHDLWVNNIVSEAQKAQQEGHPNLQPTPVATGGEAGTTGHMAKGPAQHVDPVKLLEDSLRDPYGFKGTKPEDKTGYVIRNITRSNEDGSARHPGFENFTGATASKDPDNNPKKKTPVHPGNAGLQRVARKMNEWLFEHPQGNEAHDMWDYHYGVSEGEEGSPTHFPKRMKAAERAKHKEALKKKIVTRRPSGFAPKGLSPEAQERAEKLKQDKAARREKFGKALGMEDFAHFMLGLLDEWLEENTMASAEKRQNIMESLFSRVEANYGNLFEVCA